MIFSTSLRDKRRLNFSPVLRLKVTHLNCTDASVFVVRDHGDQIKKRTTSDSRCFLKKESDTSLYGTSLGKVRTS